MARKTDKAQVLALAATEAPTVVVDRHALRLHYRPASFDLRLDWREDPNAHISTLCGVDHHGTRTLDQDAARRAAARLYPVSYADVPQCQGCLDAWAEGER